MLIGMIAASRAVLTHPTVATFQHYKRDYLPAAMLYVLLGTLVVGAIGWLDYQVDAPYTSARVAELRRQVDKWESATLDLSGVIGQPSLAAALIQSVLSSLLGFFVFVSVVHLVGRLLGGTGGFAGLAYVIALYWAPLAVAAAVAALMLSGRLSQAYGVVALGLGLFNLYLTFVAIQAGVGLTTRRAGVLVMVLVGIGLGLFAVLSAVLVALLSSVVSGFL